MADDGLEARAERREADDVVDDAGFEQATGHVEHQQRLHAVVGEALEALHGGEIHQAAGVAEEGPIRIGGRISGLIASLISPPPCLIQGRAPGLPDGLERSAHVCRAQHGRDDAAVHVLAPEFRAVHGGVMTVAGSPVR